MKEFEIYRNYGVMGSEKRNVYTGNCEAGTAVCSDKITVCLPENDAFTIYESKFGELIIETSWGWTYDINEILYGDKRPYLFAYDRDMNGHKVYLKEVKH